MGVWRISFASPPSFPLPSMKTPMTRRSFLTRTSTAALGLGLSARVMSRAQGANEKVVMGVIGTGISFRAFFRENVSPSTKLTMKKAHSLERRLIVLSAISSSSVGSSSEEVNL